MSNHHELPRSHGTPYQTGTVRARAAAHRHYERGAVLRDEPVVEVVAGNQFSETTLPMTLEAANELVGQLLVAIMNANTAAEG